ncbi:MAG: site-2 protease family protein [Oligoflexia bacterium]|nr:site-2 protease family protein [Oligoflexia bacterium]
MFLIPFLLALCFHEYAHGWVANKLGDPTARMLGRLTLNPVAHADMLGTIILPILAITTGAPFFGWAKPVPVNADNLKNPKVGMFWVALAGPGSNILLAIIAAFTFGITVRFFETATFAKAIIEFSKTFVLINLSLAFFNLLPIHPLDGGKIFAIFLPDRVNQKLEEHQTTFSILLLLLFMTGGLATVIYTPVVQTAQFMLRGSLSVFGAL